MPKMLTKTEVAYALNTSEKTIDDWVKQGKFPRPVLIGTNTRRWRESDLEAFYEQHREAETK